MAQGRNRWLLRVIDQDTGEMEDFVPSPRQVGQGGKWMKVYQDGILLTLARENKLHGQSWFVLHCLIAFAKWGNRLPVPVELATRIRLHPNTVYRAYAELVKAECIYKQDGAYFLSPLVGWKGHAKDWEIACRELYAREAKTLTEPRLQLAEAKGKYEAKRL